MRVAIYFTPRAQHSDAAKHVHEGVQEVTHDYLIGLSAEFDVMIKRRYNTGNEAILVQLDTPGMGFQQR